MNEHNYIPPSHISLGELSFRGIFSRPNGHTGCINSNCSDLTSAINRTIFDATYLSSWRPEDITILRIEIEGSLEYSIDDTAGLTGQNWMIQNITSMFG